MRRQPVPTEAKPAQQEQSLVRTGREAESVSDFLFRPCAQPRRATQAKPGNGGRDHQSLRA